MTEKELLGLHIGCLFTYENGCMLHINEPWGSAEPAPLLFAGRTAGGEVLGCFGKRASPAFIKAAEALLSRGIWESTVYEKALCVSRISLEVCFYFPQQAAPISNCRLLTADDTPLLAASFPECAGELDTAQPYIGYIQDGRIVSICRSVRKGRAHEAGIETLPALRRRGYALAALKRWTAAVLQQGHLPFYSALPENTASLQLAQKAGYQPYAQGLQIWESDL